MRSVIINTLGAAYSRKDVYFLAFDPDKILWLTAEPDRLHEGVQMILEDRQRRTELDDYQLFVLLNADGFEDAAYDDHAERIIKVLRAWTVEQLLRPLDEAAAAPVSATVMIVRSGHRDNATAELTDYCDMLHLDPAQLPEKLTLPYTGPDGSEHALDLTQMFSETMDTISQVQAAKGKNAVRVQTQKVSGRLEVEADGTQECTPPPETSAAAKLRETAEFAIRRRIEEAQSFHLARASKQVMQIRTLDFRTELQDKRAISADLQLNLARLLHNADTQGLPDAENVRCHTPKELAQLLANAEQTLKEQRDPTELPTLYYKLNDSVFSEDDAADLQHEVCVRLQSEAKDVPGVKKALKELNEYVPEAEDLPQPVNRPGFFSRLFDRLCGGMISVAKERQYFRERYADLQKEYDRERVLSDQRTVLDICAGSYNGWRTEERRKKVPYVSKPTEIRRPVLEKEKTDELTHARERCAEGILSQLSDYADVRRQAAQLQTQFRQIGRLWSDDNRLQSTKYFFRFSVVMGVIFVILMLLPFFLIGGQATDLKLSRFVAYLINSAVFVVLYAVGFLIWLRKLAKEIRVLRSQLQQLIEQSAEERRQSVLRAIQMYTKELPACIIRQLNYSAMEQTDRRNAAIDRKYGQHMQYLSDAIEEISDVRTALRTQGFDVTGKAEKRTLDLTRPPYDPANRELYLLFSERG